MRICFDFLELDSFFQVKICFVFLGYKGELKQLN